MAGRADRLADGVPANGCEPARFAPAVDAQAVAPRPILFVHGRRDPIIPFDLGQKLYDAASQPKMHLWSPQTTADGLEDPQEITAVIQFLNNAGPML